MSDDERRRTERKYVGNPNPVSRTAYVAASVRVGLLPDMPFVEMVRYCRFEVGPECGSYGLALENLRQHAPFGQPLYRDVPCPPSAEQFFTARVEDFERHYDSQGNERSLDDRLRLFDAWPMKFATAFAYEAGTSRFKIAQVCPQLLAVGVGDQRVYIDDVPFNEVDGEILDSSRRRYSHNNRYHPLSRRSALNFPAWVELIPDKATRKAHRDIVFDTLQQRYGQDRGMGVWVRRRPAQDEVRALLAGGLYRSGGAVGGGNVGLPVCLLRVALYCEPQRGEPPVPVQARQRRAQR